MRSWTPPPRGALAGILILIIGLEVLLVMLALKLWDFGVAQILVLIAMSGLGVLIGTLPHIRGLGRTRQKPEYLRELTEEETTSLTPKERLDALTTVRAVRLQKISTLGVVLGGAFTAGTLVFTFREMGNSEQGQITDRYTKAVEQLASKKPEVRLGAIYALERVALDSQRDSQAIYDVLAAYVRENDPQPEAEPPPQPSIDVQAALSVIGRRDTRYVAYRLELSKIRTPGAMLNNAILIKSNLKEANLESAFMVDANLSDSILYNAKLQGASLERAKLRNARMKVADLSKADLTLADLRSADLMLADLHQTAITGADLRGADLRKVKGLTPDEIRNEATTDSTTRF